MSKVPQMRWSSTSSQYPRLRSLSRLFSFGELALKGRAVKGNMVTKHAVDRVVRAPKEGSEEAADLELE